MACPATSAVLVMVMASTKRQGRSILEPGPLVLLLELQALVRPLYELKHDARGKKLTYESLKCLIRALLLFVPS